jgi:uncharacterized membrane protein
MKLSPISLAVLPLLTMFSAQAAVYQIVELDTNTKVRSTTGAAVSLQGSIATNGSGFLDITLDLDAIDFESDIFSSLLTSEQLEAAKNGTIDVKVKNILITYLANNPNVRNQPLGSARAFIQPQNAPVRGLVIRDLNQTGTNTEFVYAANDMGQLAAIATAPSVKSTFLPTPTPPGEDDEDAEEPEIPVIPQPYIAWVPEPAYMLGYVVDGDNSIVLPPAFNGLGGGMSAAQDINNLGQVVGFTATGVSETTQSAINAFCNGRSQPLSYCLNDAMRNRAIDLNNLLSQIRQYRTVDSIPQGYIERGALWQLNVDGQASLVQTYGFLGNKASGEPAPASEDYVVPAYYSRVNAINDAGVAVGHSLYTDHERTVRFIDGFGLEYERVYSAPHATVYQGDEIKSIVDPSEWLASVAVDINNQDLIAGYAFKSVNSVVRPKLFTYNLANNEFKMIDGFFDSSGAEPRAMNNSGKIVGRAEVIIGGTVSRRFHGFVYDAVSDRFTDLNDLVGCDAPYTLVDATAINDNGEILATALVRRPLLDSEGQQQTAEDGSIIMQEQATAVKLRPIANGQPENCGEEAGQYEREGGSINAFWLGLLAMLPLLRRRRM